MLSSFIKKYRNWHIDCYSTYTDLYTNRCFINNAMLNRLIKVHCMNISNPPIT